MRICIALPTFPALSQTWVLGQLKSLIDQKHDIQVVAVRGPDEQPVTHPVLRQYNILQRTRYLTTGSSSRGRMVPGALVTALRRGIGDVTWLGMLDPRQMSRGSGFFGSIRMADLIDRQGDFDVVHAHHGSMGIQLGRGAYAGILRAPLVATFHGSDINVRANRASPGAYQRLFESAATCTVGSEYMKGQLVGLGASPDRIRKIPMGVSLDSIPFSASDADRSGPLRLITVGRLVAFKGHEYTIRALSRLRNHLSSVEYHVVGGGPLRASLQELATKLGVADRVFFYGAQSFERVLEMYRQSHIFVLSGIQADDGSVEGQGVVLLEAQASGLPVITSNSGGAAEQIVDGQTGHVVAAGDLAELTDRIVDLCEHPERWKPMAEAGRKWVEQNYDERLLIHKLVKIYADASSARS